MTDGLVEWEDLDPDDQERVNDLVNELDDILKRYMDREKPCEDSISED